MHNDSDEQKICTAAGRGLGACLAPAPAPATVLAIRAAAVAHARRVRVWRTLRPSAVAAAAACVAMMMAIRHQPEPVVEVGAERDYGSYVALTALTTMVGDWDASGDADDWMLSPAVGRGSDFDAFSASLLLMQDSACLINGALALND